MSIRLTRIRWLIASVGSIDPLGILYGFTAVALAIGTGFAVAASNKGDDARQFQGTLVQKGGDESCYQTSSSATGDCQRLVSLLEQHDSFNRVAIGSLPPLG